MSVNSSGWCSCDALKDVFFFLWRIKRVKLLQSVAITVHSLSLNWTQQCLKHLKCLFCGHLYNRDTPWREARECFFGCGVTWCSRVTHSLTLLIRNFSFTSSLFPWPDLTQYGTRDCIAGHKNTGCSYCAVISPVICISAGLADRLLTSVRSAAVVI